MKNVISKILILLFTVGMYAQEGINYKALIKDDLGAVVASQDIDVRFTIIADTGPTNVYLETHTGATTDANGIVILAIGSIVAPTLGVFADIAWGSDTHSLNVAIDIEQDGSFVDLGTTQFMSVPYALQATTATELTGGIDKAYIAALEARIAALESQPASIGDIREGGFVFWVDPGDNTKGKVCALADAPTTLNWNLAVSYCNAYESPNTSTGVHRDWYLPSKDELQLIYANLHSSGLGNFTNNYYWSSTEVNNILAWLQNFFNGNQLYNAKDYTFSVRAVRAF